MPVSYNNAYIYKITNTIEPELFYIGSSCNIQRARMNQHRTYATANHQNELYAHMRRLGVENFKLEHIENFTDCISKAQLTARENEVKTRLNPTITTIRSNTGKLKNQPKISTKLLNSLVKDLLQAQQKSGIHSDIVLAYSDLKGFVLNDTTQVL